MSGRADVGAAPSGVAGGFVRRSPAGLSDG